MKRRRLNVFSLSFLDAMTCGFGAVVLFYMIINASVGLRAGEMTSDLRGEVDRLEIEVLEGHKNLVELRNSKRIVEDELVTAQGLAARLLDQIEQLRVELATYRDTSLASRDHINQLQSDLKTLEESARRLSASAPSEELPGERLRSFVGDGHRQYLTGLQVGGERIAVLLDVSASMLDETIVNILRRRNLPDDVKRQADKWRRAVATVDWLATQFPQSSEFQVYTFAEEGGPVIAGTGGKWLDAGDREVLDAVVSGVRTLVPDGGTNLHAGLTALQQLRPPPDNLILIVDGLPTRGQERERKRTVSGDRRLKLFRSAVREIPGGVPVNVILFPMEGDPMAASAFWNLAVLTRGSYMSPSRDWP